MIWRISRRCGGSRALRRGERLDVLVCNAGVMALPEREVTVDGHEKQMQVNHSGHFLLTSLLLETMMRTKKRRTKSAW